MRKIVSLLSAFLILSAVAKDSTGTVTGSRLNVRTKPMAASDVVCQLLKGETVTVLELKGDWAAISVPSTCNGWIKSSSLNGRKIRTATSAHVGPTTAFTAIGTLEPGTVVNTIRTRGNWTLVQAPFLGKLWVHADYITLPKGMERPVSKDPDVVAKPGRGNVGTGEVVTVSSKNPTGDVPSTPIVPPANMQVHRITSEATTAEIIPISTAKRVTRSGVIVKLEEKKGRPFTYALAAQINNRFYPFFYLSDSFKDIKKWELHRVVVSGDRQWVRGYPRPVVEIRSIVAEKK